MAIPENDNGIAVTVTRHFDVSPEYAFDAWLDPETAGKFLFATPDGKMQRVVINPSAGGNFIIVENRQGEDIEHTGDYVEIDRPHRLSFLFGVPKYTTEKTRVTIQIAPSDGGCDLTLTHDGVFEDYADQTVDGWRGILEGLARAL